MKIPPDIKLVEDALRAAAHKATHGTREERSGRFITPPAKTLAAKSAAPRSVKREG